MKYDDIKLYDFQEKVVKRALKKKKYGLFLDMGWKLIQGNKYYLAPTNK